jgi:hypothetical protein
MRPRAPDPLHSRDEAPSAALRPDVPLGLHPRVLHTDVEAILAEIGADAARYLERLVRDADRDWRSALDFLRTAGWRAEELRAACAALNGDHLAYDPGQPASWIGAELLDARVTGLCAEHGVAPDRWADAVERVGEREHEARCLATVAREFWRMNPRFHRALDGT